MEASPVLNVLFFWNVCFFTFWGSSVHLLIITMSSPLSEYVPWPSSSARQYWSSWGQLSTGTPGAGGTCGTGGSCVPGPWSWGRRPAKERAWREGEMGCTFPGPASQPWSPGGSAARWRWWWGRRARGPAADPSPRSCWRGGQRRAKKGVRRCPGVWWSSPPASPGGATWPVGFGTTPENRGGSLNADHSMLLFKSNSITQKKKNLLKPTFKRGKNDKAPSYTNKNEN